MKQIVATALVAFIGIIVLAQEAQLSGVHLVGGHRQNSTNNSTHNSTHNNSNSAVLDAVLRNLSHVQAQLNQLTLVVRQLQNSTHNGNSTHNNSTGNGNHNSTLIPGHNSTIISGGNYSQLLNISLQNSRQLNSLQNSVNYLTGLLVNLTQHLNITAGNGNGNGIHLHPLQNSTHHNSTHNRTNGASGHHFKFNQFFLN